MPFKVSIDRKGLLARQHKAFDEANRELEENFNYEISQPLWDWPRETIRKSGEVAGSPRTIRDTDELFNSYSRRREGVGRFVHSWSAPHALITHQGWVGRSGAVVPARQWTERPLETLPALFAKAYRDAT